MIDISRLAVPAVSLLIAFLAYTPQVLYFYIAPYPLTRDQTIKVNVLAVCIWITYYKACMTDPGTISPDWMDADLVEKSLSDSSSGKSRLRWCRRCNIFKPPRAHHCRTCKKCIPKMDHHCPWTANCVSYFTFPHFLRFVFYDVVGLSYNGYLLYIRASEVWNDRDMPSYLGPSIFQLSLLFVLILFNALALFMLSILLLRTLWLFVQNITTIESWEIERHETLVQRARAHGGYLSTPDSTRIRIRKQEFPYDIGFFSNMKEAMGGSANIISWFWPFADIPLRNKGIQFETNGFEDDDVVWPPPDPDRMAKHNRRTADEEPFTFLDATDDPQCRRMAFERRQEADLLRRRMLPNRPQAETQFRDFEDYMSDPLNESENSSEADLKDWKNSDGERLRDFGVDDDVESDEDDIPLAELLRRRQLSTAIKATD